MRGIAVGLLAVFVGGAIGSACRFAAAEAFDAAGYSPWLHLMVVNTAGAFALGWYVERTRNNDTSLWHVLVAVGLLGSFTTFSGLTVQFVEDMRADDTSFGVTALAISLAIGVTAAALGRVAAK
ncbi:MAG: fluoride efflux transporter FluC [Acidimicrobiia bacterium]